MRDERSRHMLNELTRKTFGFDFEGWVTGGYFEGDYIPYSLIENGMMLSNVSANKMQFDQNGTVKNYIQIGTVMTDTDHRGQGLAAQLMQHVISTYENECDGIYLFANLGATISSVLSSKRVLLTDVIKRIDVEGRCRLRYVPLGEDKDLCVAEEFNGGDDYRLYYRGAELGAIEKDKLYFPDLSHA